MIRRLKNNTVHKPGISLAAILPVTEQMAEERADGGLSLVEHMLKREIENLYERAPKRRSRGPYVLGPIKVVRRDANWYDPYNFGKVVFYARATIYQAVGTS